MYLLWGPSTHHDNRIVQVTASNVSAPGQFGTAISATGGGGGVTVNIPSGGLIMGGWQADVTSVGSVYGFPAAGVILGSSVGTATLTNDGSIGALSDRAVASRSLCCPPTATTPPSTTTAPSPASCSSLAATTALSTMARST